MKEIRTTKLENLLSGSVTGRHDNIYKVNAERGRTLSKVREDRYGE